MSQLPHLAARILNTPLMIEPHKFRAILAAIGHRLGVPTAAMPQLLSGIDEQLAAIPRAEYPANRAERVQGNGPGWGYDVRGGVAVMEIGGALTNRVSRDMDASTALRSYESIRADFAKANADQAVKGVLLRMDTPGGEVSGAFDIAEFIASQEKPVWAVTDDMAFSAGYLLASQADRVLVSKTGGLGSVGVILTHVDWSGALDKAGIKVTPIFAGARKNDFSPYEPLTDGAKEVGSDLVGEHYRMFVDAVARGRNMRPSAVRNTEAGLFFGVDAVQTKFADAVMNFPDALAEMQADVNNGQQVFDFAARTATPKPEVKQMSAEREPEVQTKQPPVDIDAQRKQASEAGYDSAAEVVELCALAGCPERAGKFLAEKKTAAEVRKVLMEAKASESEKVHVDNKALPSSGLNGPRLVDRMRTTLKSRGLQPADEIGRAS